MKEKTKVNSEQQGEIPQSNIDIKTDLEKQRWMENTNDNHGMDMNTNKEIMNEHKEKLGTPKKLNTKQPENPERWI